MCGAYASVALAYDALALICPMQAIHSAYGFAQRRTARRCATRSQNNRCFLFGLLFTYSVVIGSGGRVLAKGFGLYIGAQDRANPFAVWTAHQAFYVEFGAQSNTARVNLP